jgi:WD40 repeat protein
MFRDDGWQLAVGCEDGVIAIYDLATGKLAQRLTVAGLPYRLAFDPQGRRLAAACGDTVHVFDVSQGKELAALRHPQKVSLISGLAWHPTGRRLATGCNDRRIYLWDVETAAEVMPPWTGHTNIGIALAFNHAGDQLVSEDWNGQTRLWDARAGRLLLTMPGSAGVRFSPDDRFLGYQHDGKKLRLFRVAAGSELRVLRSSQADSAEQIVSSAIDSEGRALALTTPDWLTFFDLERSEELSSVRLPSNEMTRLAAFRSGGWLTEGTAGVLHSPMQGGAHRCQGQLPLRAVPSGDVKLAIDGRTATNPPADFYLPEMVMDLNLQAGRANTAMGSMGNARRAGG